MTRNTLLAGVAAIGLALLAAGPAGAQSASDTETRQLIERLRPTEQQMRGIRMPGTDSGTATPADPSTPTLTPASPTPADPSTANAPIQPYQPVPSAPPPPAPVAQGTTAPSGMAAVSITVNFATGSASLSPQAAGALTALGRALASPDLRPYRFRIEGHTDTVGDADMNMALSQKRAETVREFLVTRFAIEPGRLVAVGFGEGQLLVSTPDKTPEARNRRVQVVNLGG